MLARFLIARVPESEVALATSLADRAMDTLARAPGLTFRRRYFGSPFTSDTVTVPTPGMLGLSAWADDARDLANAWRATGELAEASHEAWDLVLEPLLSTGGGSWHGFSPTIATTKRLDPQEPLLVMIAGTLLERFIEPFTVAGAKIVEQAEANPDYLGGCALTETGTETISFSCWRSARAAAAFAYSPGAHLEGMTADRTNGWHDPSTEVFVRFRPLAARGTLLGANPFAGLVPDH